jgi:sulfite reductase beta subunit-like hemoprotein
MTKDHFAIQPPFTGFSPEQMEVLAELSETYADGALRVSTLRELTLEMIVLDDLPGLLRRLGAVGLNAGTARIMEMKLNGRRALLTSLGCGERMCRYVRAQDLGFVSKLGENGEPGFEVWSDEQLLFDFIREDELFSVARSITRVSKRSRVKVALRELGLEGFRALASERRPRIGRKKPTPTFELWSESNVRRQKHFGYARVNVALLAGEILGAQLRGLAQIARRFSGNNVNTTLEQNFQLRFVRHGELRAVYAALNELKLAEFGAGKENTGALRICVSGSERNTAHHADIEFYGSGTGDVAANFQVVLGATMSKNAATYGLSIGAVPAKSIPRVVGRLAAKYVLERAENESFADFIARLGDKQVKAMLDDVWLAL